MKSTSRLAAGLTSMTGFGWSGHFDVLRILKTSKCFHAAYLQGGVIMQRKKRKATTDAVEILDRRYYRGKPARLAALETARANDHVSRKIVALRTEAGLSQRQLAKLT
jgi:hypothetical protein